MEAEKKQRGPSKILIVDDIEINVSILDRILREQGYEPLCAQSVQEALDIMNDTIPQLILSDYAMPGMNGLDFCKMLKSNPVTRDIPFLFITVADSSEDKRTAYEAGVADFIRKPFEPIEVIMRVSNQLNSYHIQQELEDYNRMMYKMMEDQKKLLKKERENALLALAKLVEKRNHLGSHLHNVGHNCYLLAQSLQLVTKYEKLIKDDFVATIRTSAELHDIGNILLPDEVYSRKYASEEERERTIMKLHTDAGVQFLEEIRDQNGGGSFLSMAIDIVKYHHAYWDGTGYPTDRKGGDIPLAARITIVANDFDNLVREAHGGQRTLDECIKVINERSGTRYDSRIVEVFNKICKQLRTD